MHKHFPEGCTVSQAIEILQKFPPDALFQARDYTGDWGFKDIVAAHIDKCVYIESNAEDI